ncbi:MAG: hypothetical protein WHT08_06160 [Bryobacteraceae bacterium]
METANLSMYTLYLDAFTPSTIPMARLSEYMAAFAALLGYKEHVHFERLAEGSTAIMCTVDPVAQAKVSRRIERARFGTAPKEALDALKEIDDKLAADNATGSIRCAGEVVIRFPGRSRPLETSLGPIVQSGTLDGEVIQIGGRDETINIHIRSGGEIFRCESDKPMARRLAQFIFGPRVRLRGEGTWSRDSLGRWKLHRFVIEGFERLDETPLRDVFEKLRGTLAPPDAGRMNPVDLVRQLREE